MTDTPEGWMQQGDVVMPAKAHELYTSIKSNDDLTQGISEGEQALDEGFDSNKEDGYSYYFWTDKETERVVFSLQWTNKGKVFFLAEKYIDRERFRPLGLECRDREIKFMFADLNEHLIVEDDEPLIDEENPADEVSIH